MNGNYETNINSSYCGRAMDAQQMTKYMSHTQSPYGCNMGQMPQAYSQGPAWQMPQTYIQTPAAQMPQDYRQMPSAQTPAITSASQTQGSPTITGGMKNNQLTSTIPTTLNNTDYLAGLLTTLIGSDVRVEFLIGTNAPMIDITGELREVGANYIVIQPINTDDLVVCDMFSIKFVTVYK